VFCDDLSFEEGEAGYKALKVALDGSVSAQSDNVLIYATSNRRHLMPEYMAENLEAKHQVDGEIHPGERSRRRSRCRSASACGCRSIRSARTTTSHRGALAAHFGCTDGEIESARGEALRWALERGSRSGRVAWQFAKDWSGRSRSKRKPRGAART
jgi:predicted AAA+ superfamily ATPase